MTRRNSLGVCLLFLFLLGCSTTELEERANDAKASLKRHGVEVEGNRVKHVIRF